MDDSTNEKPLYQPTTTQRTTELTPKEKCELALKIFNGEILKLWEPFEYARHLERLHEEGIKRWLELDKPVKYRKSADVQGGYSGKMKAINKYRG